MLNFDGDVNANANANVKCEHTLTFDGKNGYATHSASHSVRQRSTVPPVNVTVTELFCVNEPEHYTALYVNDTSLSLSHSVNRPEVVILL